MNHIRRTKRAAAEEAKQQLTDFAFTHTGYAAKVPIFSLFDDHDEQPIRILARLPSSTSWSTIYKKGEDTIETTTNKGQQKYRKSLVATDSEMNDDGLNENCAAYIVVGFVLPSTKDTCYTKQAGTGGQPVGQIPPSDATLVKPPADQPILIAVSPVKEVVSNQASSSTKKESTHFYVIGIYPEELCKPYPASFSQIFFLSRFRDEATSIKARKESWTAKVKEVTGSSVVTTDGPTSTNRLLRSRDQTRIAMDTRQSLPIELYALANFLRLENNPNAQNAANHIDSILKQVNEDLSQVRLAGDSIRNFITSDQAFVEEADASEVLDDLVSRWPSLTADGLTLGRLCFINEAYHKLQLEIAAGDVPKFLAIACHQLQKALEQMQQVEQADAASNDLEAALYRNQRGNGFQCISEAHKFTIIAVRYSQSPMAIRGEDSVDDYKRLVQVIIEKLGAMLKAAEGFNAEVYNNMGDRTSSRSPAENFARYGATCDYDEAKASWLDNVKWLWELSVQREQGLGGMISNLLKELEDLT